MRPLLIASLLLVGGCMTKAQAVSMRTGGDVMPVVVIQPGWEYRLALMDAYRFDDGMRKHMMRRPSVTVEQIPDDPEAPQVTDGPEEPEETVPVASQ